MDLDRCPKCGIPWRGGDYCQSCKFVPIGAGLDKLPKKKKKKIRKYVEPGSSRGLLIFTFLGISAYGCIRYQPWQDDWEMIRSVFGQGRHHSLVGEWSVVKTLAVKPDQAWVAQEKVHKGTLKFSAKGGVDIKLIHQQSETDASGHYKQDGIKVAMRDVRSNGDGTSAIPNVINMNLAWNGNDDVIAMDKTQAIFLHRRRKGHSLLDFMQLGLRKKAQTDDGQVPGQMRGVIADMKREVSDEEGTSTGAGSAKDN